MSAATHKPSYDFFISYRRSGPPALARLIKANLESHGFKAFLDVTNLDKGYFDEKILKTVADTSNFIVILSANSLDRCVEKKDWLRLEIERAIATNRNIIPVLMPDFVWPPELPEGIRTLQRHQGVPYDHVFFDSVVQRIEKMRLPVAKSLWKRPRLLAAVLVAILAIGAAGYLSKEHRNNPASLQPTQQELNLQQEAQLLRLGHSLDEAVAKDKAIVALHGALEKSAASNIDEIQKIEGQENSLMSDGETAESQSDFTRAKADYQQVMGLHGARELEAIQSFNVVTQKMNGATDADIAKNNFAEGVTAFNQGEYAMAKTLFDQVLSRTPANWPQRTKAEDYSRRSGVRAQEQQHLAQAQAFFNAKNYDAARDEARQVIASPDPVPSWVQQAQDLIARIPAAPATPPAPAEPSPAAAEIQSAVRDAETLVQQGQYKAAWDKAAAIEQLKGDPSTLREVIKNAEETRYQQLNSSYLTANKQDPAELQNVLLSFQQFLPNAVNRQADAQKYIQEISSEIAALNAPRPSTPAATPAVVANNPANDIAEIQALLNRYAQAVANGDLNGVKAVRQLSPSDEKRMADSLKAMKGKGFALRNCSAPAITGDNAKVSCDTVLTGSKDTPPGQVTISLERVNGHWKIVP
jgi:tetratricopeptide (TPR) repeat protein